MTATFSADMLQGLADALDAAVIPSDEQARDEMDRLPSQDKTRRYHVVDGTMTADCMLASPATRTLVVCNQVASVPSSCHSSRWPNARG